VSKYTVGYKL